MRLKTRETMTDASDRYVLLAPVGMSPQIVTETIWSYARQSRPPRLPREAHVIATLTGEAHVRALLLGEEQRQPTTGKLIEPAQDRWSQLFHDVLGVEPVPIIVHVPNEGSYYPADIASPHDDKLFAELCYKLVANLTAEDAPPLVGSIAGGRKTMSAHIMTAFSLWARKDDDLCHVILNPPGAEGEREFFFPTGDEFGEITVHRIDIRFPRLRRPLTEKILADTPPGTRDLTAILTAIEPHNAAIQEPARLIVEIVDQHSDLRAIDADGNIIGETRLTPALTANLLAFAETLDLGYPEPVCVEDFLFDANGERIQALRKFVYEKCAKTDPITAWVENNDVSKARNQINKALDGDPVLSRFLTIASDGLKPPYYSWAERTQPSIEVMGETLDDEWPFKEIGRVT